jgi:hypothetical protein
MPCRRIRTASVPKVRHWTGFSRHREHPGNDGNSTTGLPYKLTPKNAEPDSYAGRKNERRCVHSQLARSTLTTPPRPSTLPGTQRHHRTFLTAERLPSLSTRSLKGHQQRFNNVRAWSGQPHRTDLSKNSSSIPLSARSRRFREAFARLARGNGSEA